MAINRVEIKDFLVFKGEFALDFSPGVNVLIGGNGTGKTTLLKVLYRLCGNGKNRRTEEFFFAAGGWNGVFHAHPFEHLRMLADTGEDVFRICVKSLLQSGLGEDEGGGDRVIVNGDWVLYNSNEFIDDYTLTQAAIYGDMQDELVFTSENYMSLPSVFIPSTNLLPQSRALPEMINDYVMDFDAVHLDSIKNARRPITRSLKQNCSKVIGKLSSVIDGEVLYENDRFFIKKSSGLKVDFAMEASGFVRLGLLWKILRNGLLEPGTIFLWDELENSLNPELIPILVDILLELSRNGVQIILATHSEILASYFSVTRQKNDKVMFTSLYKDSGQIKSEKNDRFDLLNPNNLTEEPVKLYERKLDRGLGGA